MVAEAQAGKPVLPTLYWVSQAQQYQTAALYNAHMEKVFYAPLRYMRANKLPVTISMTQLTNLFFSPTHEQNAYASIDLDPRVRKADNSILGTGYLDPLSPVFMWRDAARQMLGDAARPYASTVGSESPGAVLREIAKVYPDPPAVYLVSNNEDKLLVPNSFTGSDLTNYTTEWKRGSVAFGPSLTPAQLTDAINAGYGQRFLTLHTEAKRIVRGLFPNSQVRISGYVNSRVWGGFTSWQTYLFVRNANGRLIGNDRLKGLDSLSVSTYPATNYADNTARSIFATYLSDENSIRTINDGSLPQMEELALHDASETGAGAFSANSYTPSRYKGSVRHLMWLARPRVVREWRGTNARRTDTGHDGTSLRSAYWDALVAACAEVHSNATLSRFWTQSELAFNPNRAHPYTLAPLGTIDETQRVWPYLPVSDEPAAWANTAIALTDPVATWAFSYMIGRGSTAEYLLFAHSPAGAKTGINVTMRKDDGTDMTVTVNTTPQGNFWSVTPAGVATLIL